MTRSIIDPTVDACCKKGEKLVKKADSLRIFLQRHAPLPDTFSDNYINFVHKIDQWMRVYRKPAIDKCHYMLMKDAAPLKKKIDDVTWHLQSIHQSILRDINNSVYAGELSFSVLCPLPTPTTMQYIKKSLWNNAGWIVTAFAGSIVALTLTPFGKPVFQFFFDEVTLLGNGFKNTNFRSMHEIGKASAYLTCAYPVYRYMKEPVQRFVKKTTIQLDWLITKAAQSPLKTLAICWSAYYLSLRFLSLETDLIPRWINSFDIRAISSLAGAALTTHTIRKLKDWVDHIKYVNHLKASQTTDAAAQTSLPFQQFAPPRPSNLTIEDVTPQPVPQITDGRQVPDGRQVTIAEVD
ncbi:MAG: hypothetical protein FJZ64_02130 [Chlamydiae bacterium]|nr:hypothetical protein [Chlamydiota bacterium]